ncbi:hypothetical protein [Chitinophaga barathri]|uniref:Uncharacterized protein n=1 Tax=Chitinophaga barathri TaxID=1647451 RepID=A0A3N4MP59_9BACT|nr:hypothetical protein [Chitinophaga barathri]RPD41850.1 hypothetical protein EG028_06710 [Chitinophaga barathri]
MPPHVKIALHTPIPETLKPTFSIRLKKELVKEIGIYYPQSDILLINSRSGSFGDMMETMMRCGIVDESFNWLFGDGHVIITGNCLDGSEESVRLLWLIYALESKAIRRGGYLHFLPGSSELRNSMGPWRHNQPPYAPRSARSTHRYAILFDGNNELYRWLKTKNVLEKIGKIAIFQCNMPENSNQFLPKFPGKKFPDSLKRFLLWRLDDFCQSDLQCMLDTLQVSILIVVDSDSGRIIVSELGKYHFRYSDMPLFIGRNEYDNL